MKKLQRLCSLLLALFLLAPMLPQAAALHISAWSAYVMDADTGETLYEYNADVRRTPASMTKVMTSYIIFQELEKGTLKLDTQVPVSSHARAISRDGDYPLAVPLTKASYTVDTLLTLLHVPSGSGACVALAEKVAGKESAFVERMNATAKTLGLDATYYCVHGCGPNKITARSQAKLTKIFIDTYPAVLNYTSRSSVYFEGRTYSNGNKLLNGAYTGADGFKTGTYNDSGYCLDSTAVRNGRRVIAIAMHASSNATRISDSRTLLDEGFRVQGQKDASRASTVITLSPGAAQARQYEPVSVTASLSGLQVVYTSLAQWYVNGKPLEGYGSYSFNAHNGVVSTMQYVPNGTEGEKLDVAFVLTMPDGTQKKGTTVIPLGQPAQIDGYVNPDHVAAYPGLKLTATAVVTTQPAIHMLLPSEWQIDGTTIASYVNNKFSVRSGKATSEFIYQVPANTPSGTHTLTFVLAKGTSMEKKMSCEVIIRQPGEPLPAEKPAEQQPAQQQPAEQQSEVQITEKIPETVN